MNDKKRKRKGRQKGKCSRVAWSLTSSICKSASIVLKPSAINLSAYLYTSAYVKRSVLSRKLRKAIIQHRPFHAQIGQPICHIHCFGGGRTLESCIMWDEFRDTKATIEKQQCGRVHDACTCRRVFAQHGNSL